MSARKGVTRYSGSRQTLGERIKDEVYRQMFLLEESRPVAEVGLAVALLRAWLAAESKPSSEEDRDWLKKISSVCLEMIEAAFKAGDAARFRLH